MKSSQDKNITDHEYISMGVENEEESESGKIHCKAFDKTAL